LKCNYKTRENDVIIKQQSQRENVICGNIETPFLKRLSDEEFKAKLAVE
jgi:hypothetical protein